MGQGEDIRNHESTLDQDQEDNDVNEEDSMMMRTVPGIPDLCEQIIVVRLQRAPDLHGPHSCQVSGVRSSQYQISRAGRLLMNLTLIEN